MTDTTPDTARHERNLDVRSAALRGIAERAIAAVAPLTTAERVRLLLGASSTRWDGLARITLYPGGVTDTRDGELFELPWSELGETLRWYAGDEVRPKGQGAWFFSGLSRNGRCRDVDVLCRTGLDLDADGVGDWVVGLELLRSANMAFIVSRSSSHRPDHPKFHVHLPLVERWQGTKPEWRQCFRHAAGVFSELFDLRRNLESQPPVYGFDVTTDRLGQPMYCAARRREDAPVPDVIVHEGRALDLERLARETGFTPVAQDTAPPRRRRRSNHATPGLDGGVPSGLLQRAFQAAEWLRCVRCDGTAIVRCPWEEQHTSGSCFDSSTVIFPPTTAGGLGWFHCAHAHCDGRGQEDVLLALPPEALMQALQSGRASW